MKRISEFAIIITDIEKYLSSLANANADTHIELNKKISELKSEAEFMRAEIRQRLNPDRIAHALNGSEYNHSKSTSYLPPRSADRLHVKQLTKIIRRCNRVLQEIRKSLSEKSRKERISLDIEEAKSLIKKPGYLERYEKSISNRLQGLPDKVYKVSKSGSGKKQASSNDCIQPLIGNEKPNEETILGFLAKIDPVLYTKVHHSPGPYRSQFISILMTATEDLLSEINNSGNKKNGGGNDKN